MAKSCPLERDSAEILNWHDCCQAEPAFYLPQTEALFIPRPFQMMWELLLSWLCQETQRRRTQFTSQQRGMDRPATGPLICIHANFPVSQLVLFSSLMGITTSTAGWCSSTLVTISAWNLAGELNFCQGVHRLHWSLHFLCALSSGY